MPNVEIDETELANLRRLQSVADVISKNTKARALLQQAVEIASPDQVGPETMLRREFSEHFESLKTELAKDREERAAERAEREKAESLARLEARWARGRTVARDAGYTDDGLQRLEKWMEDNEVADHRVAMPAFERENPPSEPISDGNSGRWDFFNKNDQEQPDIKSLMEGDEDQFMRTAIPAALTHVRNQRR